VTVTDQEPSEDRARLEAERDVLLKSLDDLEAEHAAGGIDDESYQTLRDDYTARAAAVIRALRDGVDARPDAPRTSWRRRGVVIGAVVVFAIGAAIALASALGARLPGQTASGNSQDAGAAKQSGPTNAQVIQRLEEALAKNPGDVQTRLLLAPRLEASGDLSGALQQYDAILQTDPKNAVAAAQSGRIMYLSAEQLAQKHGDAAAQLVSRSKSRLDQAIAADPTYADAYYYHAIVLANEYRDFEGAQNDLQHYLVLAPNGQWSDQAHQLLAEVTNAIESPTLPNASPSTTAPPSTRNSTQKSK
jgi:cytochrome c-type biogenesis protein CcmH/NrfG